MEGLAAAARSSGIPFAGDSVGGMFGIYFGETRAEVLRRSHALRREALRPLLPPDAGRGDLPGAVGVRSGLRVRRAHADADIDATIAAARAAFEELE